jgi:hypothetical protein
MAPAEGSSCAPPEEFSISTLPRGAAWRLVGECLRSPVDTLDSVTEGCRGLSEGGDGSRHGCRILCRTHHDRFASHLTGLARSYLTKPAARLMVAAMITVPST